MLAPAAQADGLQQRRGPLFALGAGNTRKHHGERDIFRGGHRGDEIEGLKDDADAPAAMLAQLLP
jgi:hypothetical protein